MGSISKLDIFCTGISCYVVLKYKDLPRWSGPGCFCLSVTSLCYWPTGWTVSVCCRNLHQAVLPPFPVPGEAPSSASTPAHFTCFSAFILSPPVLGWLRYKCTIHSKHDVKLSVFVSSCILCGFCRNVPCTFDWQECLYMQWFLSQHPRMHHSLQPVWWRLWADIKTPPIICFTSFSHEMERNHLLSVWRSSSSTLSPEWLSSSPVRKGSPESLQRKRISAACNSFCHSPQLMTLGELAVNLNL